MLRRKAIAVNLRFQLVRLIAIATELQRGKKLRVKTTCEKYGITQRTFYRDMELLSSILPICAVKSSTVAYWQTVGEVLI